MYRYGYQKATDNYVLRVGLYQMDLKLTSMVNPDEPKVQRYIFPDSVNTKPVFLARMLKEAGVKEADAVEIISCTHYYKEYALTREQVMSTGTELDILTHKSLPEPEAEPETQTQTEAQAETEAQA